LIKLVMATKTSFIVINAKMVQAQNSEVWVVNNYVINVMCNNLQLLEKVRKHQCEIFFFFFFFFFRSNDENQWTAGIQNVVFGTEIDNNYTDRYFG
jgi:hypothetical protein